MGIEMKDPNPVETLLQEPEQQAALAQLLRDLPILVSRLEQLEKSVSFAEHVIQDKESIVPLTKEVERRIGQTGLTKVHVDALLDIARLLPEVAPLLKQGMTGLLFAKSVLEDERTMQELLMARPKIPLLEETRLHYEMKETRKKRISLRRIWRLIKHPMWKKSFIYIESFMDVVDLNQKRKG